MIFREIAKHQSNTLRMKICQQINLPSLNRQSSSNDKIAADSRKHLLLLGNGKPGFIPTQPPLAKPEKRRLLVKAFNQCKILKTLNDGKILFLYRPQDDSYSPILQELGRLREISFRAIGAGTGKKRDNDCYDHEYHHVILWDPCDLEIVGAYRITPAGEQIDKKGVEGLYSYNLFKYREDCLKTIKTSFEIGRGFIQEQYQKTNALDTLWKGIFCFMGKYPEYKNLLGVLTIPRSFSAYAQGLIISFYQLYFSGLPQLRTSLEPYTLECDKIIDFYDGSDFEQDWKKLNKTLRELGYELPWPYKQMARWFNPGGSTLVDFMEDRGFNSIAGLSICEIASLKKAYFSHYISKSAGIGSVS